MAGQTVHTEWHGFTFYDLIFPLFLFIAGVAMPFAFSNRLERGDSKVALYRHVIIRAAILVFLGLIYNDLLKFDCTTMRYTSVLGRIGLSYMFAAFIVLNTNWRGQFIWAVGLLVAYWAALKFIPVPGYGAGDLRAGHTLTDYIDRTYLPGSYSMASLIRCELLRIGIHSASFRRFQPSVRPLPELSLVVLLKTDRFNGYVKTGAMVIASLICLGLAYLWNFDFPINKNLWSSSFVLYCAAWSLLLLALFYLVIDVWRFRAWSMVFVVIGSNAILIYMARRFVDFDFTTHFFFDGILRNTGRYKPVLFTIAVVFVEWLLLLFLYRKRIFLRT